MDNTSLKAKKKKKKPTIKRYYKNIDCTCIHIYVIILFLILLLEDLMRCAMKNLDICLKKGYRFPNVDVLCI